MVFEPQTLAPGPGIGVQAMATFRWRSFQSARGRVSSTLPGSGVFHASTLGEVMTWKRPSRTANSWFAAVSYFSNQIPLEQPGV